MKEGPSRPAVRCRSQATASCCRQERWWCCVKKVRERHAVREMKEAPSEPSCRGALVVAHIFGVAVTSIVHKENLVLAMITGRKRRAGD
jgi:cytochrome b